MKSIAIILLLSAAEFTLQEENPCKLPADPGPCRGKHSQYYYDWDSQQCAEFTYGGCEGNDNNFDSIEECEAACPGGEEHEDEDPCELPADSGPCRAHFVKYYYNKESNKCDTFVYGGCEGNDNRFDTVEECEAKCAEEEPAKEPCKLPADPGPCKGKFPRYYYDWDSKQCAEFTYGGCRGNENNYDSIAECEATCPGEEQKAENPCELPSDSGPCMAYFTKYYYNKESKKCETFVYGGCQGNENRFDTLEECEAKCAEEKPVKDPCKLPADPGPCRGKFPRYYYDWDSKQCTQFTYGGCEGNANNYDSIAECEATCPGEEQKPENPCELPSDSGPCMAYFTKYYYNKESKKCETFVYGGCQGNENRFDTLEECEAKCAEEKPVKDPCKLPADPGPCRGKFPRYYYDWDSKKCTQFTYGGCEGNANNYDSIAECEATCPGGEQKAENPCELPSDSGPCMAYFTKYYYNKESKKCETFVYGGCQGNENRFDTLEECEAKCAEEKPAKDPCKLPADPGPCRGKFPRYYYDWDSKQCTQFTYGGCEGNANNYDSIAECEVTCPGEEQKAENPCELPSDSGPCMAYFTKYFYNKESKKCETFVYGGCQGNENRFDTLEDCEAKCAESKKENVHPVNPDVKPVYPDVEPVYPTKKPVYTDVEPVYPTKKPVNIDVEPVYPTKKPVHLDVQPGNPTGDVCILPKERGPCKKSIQKWFFDSQKKVCKTFFYGGCEGNGNRFDTKEECQQQCVDNLPASVVCRLPYAMGSCRMSLKRFYFDSESKACKTFIYTGCEGNANNFRTEDECSAKCISE